MTQVLILLAALNGYHASAKKCEEVAESLCSLLSFNMTYGKAYKGKKVSTDLDAIGVFYETCKKPQNRIKHVSKNH